MTTNMSNLVKQIFAFSCRFVYKYVWSFNVQPRLTWHHQGLTCVLKPADLLTYLPCYLPYFPVFFKFKVLFLLFTLSFLP